MTASVVNDSILSGQGMSVHTMCNVMEENTLSSNTFYRQNNHIENLCTTKNEEIQKSVVKSVFTY